MDQSSPANPQLSNRCQLLEKEINAIAADYSRILPDEPEISHELARLNNRAGEYRAGSFIALVVGPAKSGKSTLVNLIAGAYVSPTSFLECTVRPSIISRKKEDEEEGLTCYTATAGVGKIDKVKHIDAIIDCVRGLDTEENLIGIDVERLPLTPKNIKERVELGLENSLTSDTLATSIRTPGGDLLKEEVFLIDMPGFDGAYMNIDDPLYDAIAQRADLIIFVQSSNAAFSKVSKEFLKKLAECNKDVPVCLIHNIFDAAWWRSQEEKDSVVKEQLQFACEEIRAQGFKVNVEHCHAINLGAVQDFRKSGGGFDDNGYMGHYDEEFRRIENEMFERIISRKDAIRLSNCINRTQQQLSNLWSAVTAAVLEREELIRRYDDVKARLGAIDRRLGSEVKATVNAAMVEQLYMQHQHLALSNYSNNSIKYSNSDATSNIAAFIDRLNEGFNKSLGDILGVSLLETALYHDYMTKITGIREKLASISAPLSEGVLREALPLSYGGAIDIRPGLDVKLIVPVKGNMISSRFGSPHSAQDIRDYIEDVGRRLIFTPNHTGQNLNLGYLLVTVLPAVQEELDSSIGSAMTAYQSHIDAYIEAASGRILSDIIGDYDRYVATTQSLKALQAKLDSLRENEKK